MHIHLPKPLHGWRELLGEVGVIVIGVLIALGAEQIVQAVHQNLEARQAEDNVRSELEFNLGRLQSRMQTRMCVDRRIAEMQTLIDGASSQPNILPPNWIGRPQYWTLHYSSWEAEAQAGRAALINQEMLPQYGILYALMHNVEGEMAVEQADWARLRMLEHLHRLDQPALFEISAALQDARYRSWRVVLVTSELFDFARRSRLRPAPNNSPASRSVCLSMTTTREAANRTSALPFGNP